MPNTTNGLPYPSSFDPVANGAQNVQDLAEAVDTKTGLWKIQSGSFTTVSAGSPLVLDNVLSTNFPHYRIVISWTQATAGGWLNMRGRNIGGVISTATYDNQGIDQYLTNVLASGGLGGTAWSSLAYNYNLGFWSYFTADITFATVNQPTFLQGRGGTKRTGGGGAFVFARETHGIQDASTVWTGLNIYPDGGSMTGSYSLYGYN
jgi:hypothetical protein